MTLNLNRPSTPSSRDFQRRSRQGVLRQGVSVVSLTALLGGQAVFAQTAPHPGLAVGQPSAAALAPTPEAPAVVAPVDMVPTDSMTLAPDPLPPQAAAVSEGNEAFIDATTYTLGATERSGDRPQVLPTAQIGMPMGTSTLGEGGVGLGVGQTTASGQSYTYAQPDLKYYYNRTLRPPGRIGNGNIRLIFPLSIPAPISSAFGWRIHPISGEQRFHSGTDLAAPMGTPVLAAYAGQVAIADFLGGYGLAIALDHNQGTQQTLYGHLSEVFVKPGEMVKQGDVIGRVGSTGNSTGPHLHFEFRQLTSEGWMALDPGEQLEYSLSQFVKALQIGGVGTAIGSFNVGLAGNADLTAKPTMAALIARQATEDLFKEPAQMPTVTVSKTVYPQAMQAQKMVPQSAPKPGISNQQLSFTLPTATNATGNPF